MQLPAAFAYFGLFSFAPVIYIAFTMASRMEGQGLANCIQCTEAVHNALPTGFLLEPRGSIDIKGKGLMPT